MIDPSKWVSIALAAIGAGTELVRADFSISSLLRRRHNRYKHLGISKEAIVFGQQAPCQTGPFEPDGRDNKPVLSQKHFMQNSHIDVVSENPGDARNGSAYRKHHYANVNFLKVFVEVSGGAENRLFFDSSKGRKMDALSMSEKTWPN